MAFVWAISALVALLSFSWFLLCKNHVARHDKKTTPSSVKRYPWIGHLLALLANKNKLEEWLTELVTASATQTVALDVLGASHLVTANPSNIEHILKTKFHNYPKGDKFQDYMQDFLGKGIFNVDGEEWKLQRKIASHEFNTTSLRNFIEKEVQWEIKERLLPLLTQASENKRVLDLQDVLKRFAFDNICKVAFGIDPQCLELSLPDSPFAEAFDTTTAIVTARFREPLMILWRFKRFFDFGSEKKLKESISVTKSFANQVIRCRKEEMKKGAGGEKDDLLSRFLALQSSGAEEFDDVLVRDIVISFMLAGRDTTSSALTWFFWLLSLNPRVTEGITEGIRAEILRIINKRDCRDYRNVVFSYEELKEMHYLHASLCESMRLYAPVPNDAKYAVSDDVLPDGTVVSKGSQVIYSPYAMGRCESVWGKDCLEFKPERWLKVQEDGSCVFMAESPFKFPVFQAGPRVCIGKEMAFIQMKSIAASVIRGFDFVVPVDFRPKMIFSITLLMEAFPINVTNL